MKFRTKPIVKEAIQFLDNPNEVQNFCPEGRLVMGDTIKDTWFAIYTLEGVMRADRGDWIIRGLKGEFYPCKPDIFEATYEAVE